MFKTTMISTIFVTAASLATAEPTIEHDLSLLPADVALQVARLQEHGDRFEPAIRAILAEAAKPAWAFDDCGHQIEESLAVTPNS